MTDEPVQIVSDPDGVPICHITGVISQMFSPHVIAMNLVSDRMAVGTDGSTRPDLIIAARLRFDLDVARRIRDQIDAHLRGMTNTAPPDTKPN